MRELFRAAFVIARRDFAATVLSRAFIFFLITPLFPVLLGGVFGGIGARVAAENEQPIVPVVATKDEFAQLSRARERLAAATRDQGIVILAHLDIDDPHPERVRGSSTNTRPAGLQNEVHSTDRFLCRQASSRPQLPRQYSRCVLSRVLVHALSYEPAKHPMRRPETE